MKKKIVRINGESFKSLLKETISEVMNERTPIGDSIKVFLKKEQVLFLEELLDNLQPDNDEENVMIRKIKTSLNDAQVNL